MVTMVRFGQGGERWGSVRRVMAGKVETAGNLIRSFLLDLTQDDLMELKY